MNTETLQQVAEDYSKENYKSLSAYQAMAFGFIAGVKWLEEEQKKQIKSVVDSMPDDHDLMEDSKI